LNPVIQGIGWVTASGMGWGRSRSSFSLKDAPMPSITRKMVFDTPYQRFGRMDPYSKLGLSAVAFALKDAGLDEWKDKRPIGIIASTVYGCLGTDMDYFDTILPQGGLLASPNLFAYTLPSSFLGEAAIRFGLTGSSFIVNEPSLAGLTSLRMALESISWGESETMLSGVCDLGCPPDFPIKGRAIPAAVFFLIQRDLKENSVPYGELWMDRDGVIFFEEVEIKSVAELAQACLAAKHH